MKISRSLLVALVPLALLPLGACAENFTANVARFQRLPVPQGQTFRIEPVNMQDRNSLEFETYAQSVSAHLAQQGYRPSAGSGPADLIVQVTYGVDHGQQKVVTTPGFGGWGGGFGGWGGGFGGYGRFGGGWGGPGWRYGWDDPFWGGGYPDVSSYTVYASWLTMKITRADGVSLFEGRARAHATTDDLTQLVPNLIDAMFTGFPGNSGQDIRITIPPRGTPKKG